MPSPRRPAAIGTSGTIDASGGDITFKVNGTTVTLSHTFAGSGGTGKYNLSELETAINGTAASPPMPRMTAAGI